MTRKKIIMEQVEQVAKLNEYGLKDPELTCDHVARQWQVALGRVGPRSCSKKQRGTFSI